MTEKNFDVMSFVQKHLHPGIWITVFGVFVAAVGYLIWASQSGQWPFAEPYQEPWITNQGDNSLSEVEGWQIYHNEKYGFEFRYPPSFLVGKYKPETTVTGDLGLNDAIVLVESELVAMFSNQYLGTALSISAGVFMFRPMWGLFVL